MKSSISGPMNSFMSFDELGVPPRKEFTNAAFGSSSWAIPLADTE
jgi:hypothetical protein